MRCFVPALAVTIVLAAPTTANADRKRARGANAGASAASCYRELRELGVRFAKTRRDRVDMAVEVRGPLGGVTYRPFRRKKKLVIDCSLAVSLARAGRYLTAQGIERAVFSSAYSKRYRRGSKKPSQHWLGLAIDVHVFAGDDLGKLAVKDAFERGLGDDVDCIGDPATEEGRVLKTVNCQMRRSGWFRYILDPDTDAAHHNHFHLEARPWGQRRRR